MWPFSKKSTLPGVTLLLDIRSSSVGGALVVTTGTTPTIIYAVRNRVFFENTDDSKLFIKKIMGSLDVVLKKIETEGIKKNAHIESKNNIETVTCMFASPWYKSHITNLHIQYKTPTTFTQKALMRALTEKETTSTKEFAPKKGESIIEKDIMSVCMNGYSIRDPFNKKASDISLSFYESLISTKTKNDITEKISDMFHTSQVTYMTHPSVIMSTIKHAFAATTDFLYFDVGGETTDIGLVRDTKLQDLITIPKGAHGFIRNIMKGSGLDAQQAISQLQLFYTDALDTKHREKLQQMIEKAKGEWMSEMHIALKAKWNTEITPPTIFTTADIEIADLVKDILLSKEFYTQTLKINREPIVHHLHALPLQSICSYAPDAYKDPLLSILAYITNQKNN